MERPKAEREEESMRDTRSYVITNYPVPSLIYELLRNRLKDCKPKEWRFFCHVLASNLINLGKEKTRNLWGWGDTGQELYSGFIRDRFRQLNVSKFIQKHGVIEVSEEYSTAAHRCRAYTIVPNLLEQILDSTETSIRESEVTTLVNLLDGKPYNHGKRWREGLEDEPESPQLVKKSMAAFHYCPFNRTAISDHLANLKEQITANPQKRFAYYSDRGCAERLIVDSKPHANDLFEYQPYYRPQSSGRVSEVGGGLQSCSRAMKQAAFSGVPDVHNYDLKASQAYGLLQELEDARIEAEWLRKYLAQTDAASAAAAAVGLPKDVYKDCFYATIMGASHVLPPKPRDGKIRPRKAKLPAIFDTLLTYCGNRASAEQAFRMLTKELKPLKCLVDQWCNWLLSDIGLKAKRKRNDTKLIYNACGRKLRLGAYNAEELRRKAPSFILQGLEANYIHHLTVLARRYGFEPISNQHDGLVTLGGIPDVAISVAREKSGFRYAKLVEKAFV